MKNGIPIICEAGVEGINLADLNLLFLAGVAVLTAAGFLELQLNVNNIVRAE